MPSQLHIRTPDWTKDGRNYTDVKARCGQDVHTDAPSGRANRINAVLIDTPIQYQRAYERLLYAIATNNMCASCQRHRPASSNPPGSTVPQGMGTSAPLPSTWGFLVQVRPPDAVSDVPQRRPHRQAHNLVPRGPAGWPVREQLHQVAMQAHHASAPCEPAGSSTSGRATSPDDPSSRGLATRVRGPRLPASRCAT